MDEFDNTTAVSAVIAAQQDNARDAGRFMTLTKHDFPFRPANSTFHEAARALYAVIPFEDVYLPTAKQWNHKQTQKSTAKLVRHCRNVERTIGIISKSISTYERPYTADHQPMAVLTVTRVPKRDSVDIACLVIRLTHAMTNREDDDLKTTNKDGETVWKFRAEEKIAQRDAQRRPENIIAALINSTHFKEFKEMRGGGRGGGGVGQTSVSLEVQKAYRRENFHKFLNIEQYREMCSWYSNADMHPDDWQSHPVWSEQSPLNPFNVFTLQRACSLAEKYGADPAYCHMMAWETNVGLDGIKQYNTPFNGSTTYRLLLKEFGPEDLPGFLFPWEKRPLPLETDAMFLHLRKRFGYDLAQSEAEKKEIVKQAQQAMQYECMQQETGVRNNLFTLKDRIESELSTELAKAGGNVLDQQRVRKQLAEKHLQDYLRVFQRNGDIPKPLRAIAIWLDDFLASHKTPCLPVKKWSKNLTWAQEQRAGMLSCLESLTQVYTNHRELVLCSYAARHVYWRTDLHPNIYCYGDFSVGKSFMFTLVGKMMIPGTSKAYTSSTARADFQETSDEFDMLVEINEEAKPKLFCSDVKHAGMSAGHGGGSTMDDSGQNDEAAAFRARLTSGKISWKACGIVEGIRFRQDVTIPANTLFFMAANWRKERVPANMMSRFIALPAHAKERSNGTLLQKMIASKRQLPGYKDKKDYYFQRYRRNQAFTAYIAVAMWLKKLHPMTTLVSDNVFLAALDRSRTAGLTGTNDIRRFEFLRYLVDTVAVDDVINFLLDSPLSPIAGQQWNWEKHFDLFNPLMRTETEQAVFVLEMMGGYEDPMEYHIYKAINAAFKTPFADQVEGDEKERQSSEGFAPVPPHPADSKSKSSSSSSKEAARPISSWFNHDSGPRPMRDDSAHADLPYIERKDEWGVNADAPQSSQQPQQQQPQQQPQQPIPAADELNDQFLTKDQIEAKNYVVIDWKDTESNNRYYNDWNRCEVLWKHTYDHIVGVKCNHDEGVHFLFSRLSQKVPCAVNEGATIPAMVFAGTKLLISMAVLSGNAQFRLRDSIIGILNKPHMRRMTYLMGQTEPENPYVWFTKEMPPLAEGVPAGEPLKLYNLNFVSGIDKQIITNMFEHQTTGRFKSWAEQAMEDLLQDSQFDVLDCDMEKYAHALRMAELNWSHEDIRRLLAPTQDAKDPRTMPYLIPWERDAIISKMARAEVAAKRQPKLLRYPDCYHEQIQADKERLKRQEADSKSQSLAYRQQQLLKIQEESIKRALDDYKERGVQMEANVDDIPPLENAEDLPEHVGMDVGGDAREGKEAKRERRAAPAAANVPLTPLRRARDGGILCREAHPEIEDMSMMADDDNSRGPVQQEQEHETGEVKQDLMAGDVDFSAFYRDQLQQSRGSAPQPQPQRNANAQQERPFGFVPPRSLRRLSSLSSSAAAELGSQGTVSEMEC